MEPIIPTLTFISSVTAGVMSNYFSNRAEEFSASERQVAEQVMTKAFKTWFDTLSWQPCACFILRTII